MNRYKKLIEEIDKFAIKDRIGKLPQRKNRIKVLKNIVSILAKSKDLPENWHHINNQHIESIVNHWKKKGLSNSTIANYLSGLRIFFKKNNINYQIPTNLELGTNRKYNKQIVKLDLTQYNNIDNPYVKCIFGFELLFGLHRIEVIRLTEDNLIDENNVWVTRNIAFNSKERLIPIITDEQHELLNNFRSLNLGRKSIIDALGDRNSMVLYKAYLSMVGLTTQCQHRRHYIKYRTNILINENKSTRDIRKAIKSEFGISSNHLIKIYAYE